MKKYLLGIFALLLAVGFTAFTPEPERTTGTYWWHDGEDFLPYEGEVCEGAGMIVCTKPHPDPKEPGTVTIYESQNLNDPLLYDGN